MSVTARRPQPPEAVLSRNFATSVQLRAPILSACALLVVYWSVAAAIIAIDPYDLYPWGQRPNVERAQFHLGRNENRLVSLAVKDPTPDVVSIGSSTARMYSADDIVAALPGTRRALNLT